MIPEASTQPADDTTPFAAPDGPADPPHVLQTLLLRRSVEDAEDLDTSLRELSRRPGTPVAFLGGYTPGPDPLGGLRAWPGLVLVVARDVSPRDASLAGLLGVGAGAVAVAAAARLDDWRALAAQFPVVLLSPSGATDDLWMAIVSAAAACARAGAARRQAEELQQRIDDRILIERAKGVLTRRLQIGEEQAYKRLRSLARRQRRPMRDVARAVLDAHSLLDPLADESLNGEGTE